METLAGKTFAHESIKTNERLMTALLGMRYKNDIQLAQCVTVVKRRFSKKPSPGRVKG